ncbi:MAG: Uncharacterized protein CEN89_743 [Candidatus Berkelbacteria bacterium Licking1014_7]|uniref:Rod shape-determining protein RodA n=1 Tax=Candidatus Berkelbacteria bacterium Licking1014_7 TaxID=2017147 RepID=A0A554LI66_9BACT|nr:MAG: Uncharacterized protein CEN89_743 [Candidatus Berkelbacteria bacterium Licking1014_7]
MRKGNFLSTIDWFQVVIILALLSFGSMALFGFSGTEKIHLGWLQIFYSAIGLVLMTICSFVDYRWLKGVGWWLFSLGLVILVLVMFFGQTNFGAKRWIDFKILQFQPSEIVKIIFIIMLAKFLSERDNFRFKHLIYLLAILILPVMLIISQPDFGTSTVYFAIFLGLMFISKIPQYYWLILLVFIAIATPLIWFNLYDYQKQRIVSFVDPQSNAAASYNVEQSKIAIGSGGLFGRGIGQGTQSQLKFLPVAYSDFIFAAIAEGTGFFGAIILILAEFLLVWRLVVCAKVAQDGFGWYFCAGLAILILYQTFINIGGNLGFVPVTGVPLPLVSYGGTGLISYLAGLGVAQSIYLRHKKLSFE